MIHLIWQQNSIVFGLDTSSVYQTDEDVLVILSRAREIAQKLLSERNSEMQHTLCAVGHCHIDTGRHTWGVLSVLLLPHWGIRSTKAFWSI